MVSRSLHSFLAVLANDPGMLEDLEARLGPVSEGISAIRLQSFAGENGFHVSIPGLGELADEELEAMAGGIAREPYTNASPVRLLRAETEDLVLAIDLEGLGA